MDRILVAEYNQTAEIYTYTNYSFSSGNIKKFFITFDSYGMNHKLIINSIKWSKDYTLYKSDAPKATPIHKAMQREDSLPTYSEACQDDYQDKLQEVRLWILMIPSHKEREYSFWLIIARARPKCNINFHFSRGKTGVAVWHSVWDKKKVKKMK